MSNNPLISVIMTSYNNEKTIEKSIQSILNQTFKNFELIIIDDCSKDNSKKIIKKYKLKDKRIVIYNNSSNQGISKSLNIGLKLAKGKYIAIQDSDDYSLKDRLKIEYNYLEKYPKIFLVGSSINKLDTEGNYIYTTKRINWPSIILNTFLIFKKNNFNHSSVMYRNEKKYFYNEDIKYAIDYSYYLNLIFYNKKFKNIRKILSEYTYNSEGVSIKKSFEQEIENIFQRNKYILKKYFNKEINNKKEYIKKIKLKKYKLKLKLQIKNDYRSGKNKEGNKKLFLYMKKYKKIPIKYFIAYLISKLNKDFIRKV